VVVKVSDTASTNRIVLLNSDSLKSDEGYDSTAVNETTVISFWRLIRCLKFTYGLVFTYSIVR
jgi:hypothetical protein